MTDINAHSRIESNFFANRIDDIVRRAGISRAHVYVMISDGRLKARKIAGRTIVLETDFREFLDNLPTWREVNGRVLPQAA